MKLPVEISPNPLLTSTVEIRFSSNILEDDVLNFFYPLFNKTFPKVKENQIPKPLKMQPALEFAADYIFSGQDYSLSVANNSIAFENVGTYHFWKNYFPVIKTNLELLKRENVVTSIKRVGVRYASVFDGETSMQKVLKSPFGVSFDSYTEDPQIFSTNLKKEYINIFLQIMPNAIAQGGNGSKRGFYIDIDSSSEGKGDLKFGNELFDLIDNLHLEGKKLFFSLLSQEFLKTLNPKY